MPDPFIYIAGAFRAGSRWEQERNVRAAEEVGMQVALAGGVPIIPHSMYRNFDGTLSDHFWLESTMALLRRCDGILLLSSWRKSKGATGEADQAAHTAMPMMTYGASVTAEVLKNWVGSVRRGMSRGIVLGEG